MNTIHQWLEGKKKECNEWHTNEGQFKSEMIADLQASLPTLLSTMEAEIKERIAIKFTTNRNAGIGAPENEFTPHKLSKSAYKDLDTIIHNYFNPQE